MNTNELKVKNSNNNPDTDILSGLQFSSIQAVNETDNIAIVRVFPPDHRISKLIEKAKANVELEKDKQNLRRKVMKKSFRNKKKIILISNWKFKKI